jgi:hypothetical protein
VVAVSLSIKFFRSKILNLSLPEILQEADRLDKEARAIKKDALRICWYMRGMSYSEAVNLSYEERQLVSEIIKDNLETTKKTGLNFF